MIFESSVQAVIDISRIEEVVRDYVNLRPRGSNLTGLCPIFGGGEFLQYDIDID